MPPPTSAATPTRLPCSPSRPRRWPTLAANSWKARWAGNEVGPSALARALGLWRRGCAAGAGPSPPGHAHAGLADRARRLGAARRRRGPHSEKRRPGHARPLPFHPQSAVSGQQPAGRRLGRRRRLLVARLAGSADAGVRVPARHQARRAIPGRPLRDRLSCLCSPRAAPAAALARGGRERRRPQFFPGALPPPPRIPGAAWLCSIGAGPAAEMEAALVIRPLLAALSLLGAQIAPSAAPPAPLGELHFVAHWRLLEVGTATLTSGDVGGLRQIRFSADSNGVVNLFYPVRDDNETSEGRRHRKTEIVFAPDQRQLVLDETDLAAKPPVAKHEVKPIPGCVLDLLGALEFLRAQPLHIGDRYAMQVNQGGATRDVQVMVDLHETVATPAGRFSAVRVTP